MLGSTAPAVISSSQLAENDSASWFQNNVEVFGMYVPVEVLIAIGIGLLFLLMDGGKKRW